MTAVSGNDMPRNNLRHGMTGTRFHNIWRDMKGRCSNPSKTSFKNYGSKGISVSARWLTFENFMEDMLESYEAHVRRNGVKQTSIERIDVKGEYSKKNCRWATRLEQGNNKTNNNLLTFQSKAMTAAAWARELGISEKLIANRIYKLQWSVEKALTTPKGKFTKKTL